MYTSKSFNKRMKGASVVTQTEPHMSELPSATEECPNWLELPQELMENILERVGTEDILTSARRVCKTWQKIYNDPVMWKVIDLQNLVYGRDRDFVILIAHAVNLSRGELIDISIEGFGTEYLLYDIFLCSSKLNSLSLTNCAHMTGSGLIWAIEKVPQLEKLHLSLFPINPQEIELIGRNCPQLKSFTMNSVFQKSRNDDHALAIAKNMRELRHLQLLGGSMTNVGLVAILKGCPHLKSLDVRRCNNLNLRGNLGKLCAKRIEDFKRPNDSMENRGSYHLYHEDSQLFDDYLCDEDNKYFQGYLFEDIDP